MTIDTSGYPETAAGLLARAHALRAESLAQRFSAADARDTLGTVRLMRRGLYAQSPRTRSEIDSVWQALDRLLDAEFILRRLLGAFALGLSRRRVSAGSSDEHRPKSSPPPAMSPAPRPASRMGWQGNLQTGYAARQIFISGPQPYAPAVIPGKGLYTLRNVLAAQGGRYVDVLMAGGGIERTTIKRDVDYEVVSGYEPLRRGEAGGLFGISPGLPSLSAGRPGSIHVQRLSMKSLEFEEVQWAVPRPSPGLFSDILLEAVAQEPSGAAPTCPPPGLDPGRGGQYCADITLRGYMTPTRVAPLTWMKKSAAGKGDLHTDITVATTKIDHPPGPAHPAARLIPSMLSSY